MFFFITISLHKQYLHRRKPTVGRPWVSDDAISLARKLLVKYLQFRSKNDFSIVFYPLYWYNHSNKAEIYFLR